jgi:transcriptional regulator with XRE-family HTH domain
MLQKLGIVKNGSIFVTPTATMTIINPNIIIGQNIRTLREKMGLTQEALAQYLNAKREAIAYYEIGQRSIPSAQLSKLANLFCMNEYDFYEEDLQGRSINIAFAFRADEFQAQDLESIAQFKKIVRNYISMKKAIGNV